MNHLCMDRSKSNCLVWLWNTSHDILTIFFRYFYICKNALIAKNPKIWFFSHTFKSLRFAWFTQSKPFINARVLYYRKNVSQLQAAIDPEGAQLRKLRKLRWRRYISKVWIWWFYEFYKYISTEPIL